MMMMMTGMKPEFENILDDDNDSGASSSHDES